MWQNEEMSVSGPKIPQALEKILQLKEIRQEQLTDPTGQYSCIFLFFDKAKEKRVTDKMLLTLT